MSTTITRILALSGLALLLAAAPASAKIMPPWEATPVHGKHFSVPGANNVSDLHGDVVRPQLVIFFAGNQFMVVPDLIKAFQKKYPQYRRVYVQTLPPGIGAQQIEQGALIVGTLRITLRPDIFTQGRGRLMMLQKRKGWFDRTVDYARNRLAIMILKGNPKGITGLKDLGRKDVRVSMPNPKWEGIAHPIIQTFFKAGGRQLVNQIMKVKVRAGTTMLTFMHHRQTPMRLMEHRADCGPTWYTEAYFQKMIGNPIDLVKIPDRQNRYVVYTAARLKKAPHPRAAARFLKFLVGPESQAIYRRYGFLPPK
jgi:molybdate transport system substrate-binding protein